MPPREVSDDGRRQAGMSRGQVVYTLHLWPPLGHAAHYTGKSESSRFLKAAGSLYGSEFGELAAWVRPSDGSAGHEGPERVEVRFGWPPVGRAVGELGQHVLGHQVLLVGRGLARPIGGPGDRRSRTTPSATQQHLGFRNHEPGSRLPRSVPECRRGFRDLRAPRGHCFRAT